MDTDLDISTGPALKLARKACRLTQAELAGMVGIHQSNIGQLERGGAISERMQDRLQGALASHLRASPDPSQAVVVAARVEMLRKIAEATEEYQTTVMRYQQGGKATKVVISDDVDPRTALLPPGYKDDPDHRELMVLKYYDKPVPPELMARLAAKYPTIFPKEWRAAAPVVTPEPGSLDALLAEAQDPE